MKRFIYFLLPGLVGILGIAFFHNYYSKLEIKKVPTITEKCIIVVHFDKTVVSGSALRTKVDNLQSVSIRNSLKQCGINDVQAVFRNRYNALGILKPLKYKSDMNLFLEGWQELPGLEKSKAEKLVGHLKNEKGVLDVFIEEPLNILPCALPHDTYYNLQWHLKSSSYPNADIDAEQAWDINKGRNDVIIAVCDGGVDYTHPDLDPGNRSHVITGYDSGDDDNDPMDDLPSNDPESFAGHGTKIAGVIGAITDNYQGVSGIMWNCKIMPVKMVGSGSIKWPFGGTIINFSTTARPTDVADAIDYAVNNGAHIINLSYGFKSMGYLLNEVILRVPLLYSTLVNAYNNNKVIVASMGNEYEGGNPKEYPAGFHEVIAVGNLNISSLRAPSSSTGSHISVSAPGTSIYTTQKGGGTTYFSGTSAAAPVVSGVAGLIISQGLNRSFNLTNDDVRHILEQTADDIQTYGIGFDNETGFGKVNAYKALALLAPPNQLYHVESYGGTSVKIHDIDIWIYIGSKWGLTAGNYIDVDQYEITKHISFSIPFCSVPKVWIRERESVTMSFATPNDGYPYAQITNITKTGFDVRYSAFFIHYNVIGQTLNKWVPAEPNLTKIAYTAVGEPNPAGAATLSGPVVLCTAGSTYTINNLQSCCTISWNCGSYVSKVSAQGSNPCIFKATGNGETYIEATIYDNSSCGSFVLPRKTIWAGIFQNIVVTGQTQVCPNSLYTYTAQVPGGHSSSYTYTWTYPSNWLYPYKNQNTIQLQTPSNPNYGPIRVSITNCSGTSGYSGITVYPGSGCGGYFMLFPNPASDEVNITINENSPFFATVDSSSIRTDNAKVMDEELIKFAIRIYDNYGNLLSTKERTGKSFSIPLGNLKDGNYIIEVSDGKNSYRERLIISHD